MDDFALQVTVLGRDLLVTSLLLVAPVIVVSLLVGLLISIGQTITSVQEQTLSFAPRIVAVVVTMLFLIPWYLSTLKDFCDRIFIDYMGEMIR